MDPKELQRQRAEVVKEVEEWLEPAVRAMVPDNTIERVKLPDEYGVYWRILGLRDVPVLLGVSERALEKYSGDEIAQGLEKLNAIQAAARRIDDDGPGEGMLLRSDGTFVPWNPARGVTPA